MKILWIFYVGGGAGLRGHFYAFYGLFLRSMYRMGMFFGAAKVSNIFWGMPDSPDTCC